MLSDIHYANYLLSYWFEITTNTRNYFKWHKSKQSTLLCLTWLLKSAHTSMKTHRHPIIMITTSAKVATALLHRSVWQQATAHDSTFAFSIASLSSHSFLASSQFFLGTHPLPSISLPSVFFAYDFIQVIGMAEVELQLTSVWSFSHWSLEYESPFGVHW